LVVDEKCPAELSFGRFWKQPAEWVVVGEAFHVSKGVTPLRPSTSIRRALQALKEHEMIPVSVDHYREIPLHDGAGSKREDFTGGFDRHHCALAFG
jgi:hypothetical protein